MSIWAAHIHTKLAFKIVPCDPFRITLQTYSCLQEERGGRGRSVYFRSSLVNHVIKPPQRDLPHTKASTAPFSGRYEVMASTAPGARRRMPSPGFPSFLRLFTSTQIVFDNINPAKPPTVLLLVTAFSEPGVNLGVSCNIKKKQTRPEGSGPSSLTLLPF